jgi:hypothetical protein
MYLDRGGYYGQRGRTGKKEDSGQKKRNADSEYLKSWVLDPECSRAGTLSREILKDLSDRASIPEFLQVHGKVAGVKTEVPRHVV